MNVIKENLLPSIDQHLDLVDALKKLLKVENVSFRSREQEMAIFQIMQGNRDVLFVTATGQGNFSL